MPAGQPTPTTRAFAILDGSYGLSIHSMGRFFVWTPFAAYGCYSSRSPGDQLTDSRDPAPTVLGSIDGQGVGGDLPDLPRE